MTKNEIEIIRGMIDKRLVDCSQEEIEAYMSLLNAHEITLAVGAGESPANIVREMTPNAFRVVTNDNKKIQCIKIIRQITSCGLKEAKDMFEAMEDGRWYSMKLVKSQVSLLGTEGVEVQEAYVPQKFLTNYCG